jgi:SAM-dependent methyltransferase
MNVRAMKNNFELFLSNTLGIFPQYTNKTVAYQYYKGFSIIARFLNHNGKILDWGCGNCFASYFLLSNNQQVYAYGFGESAPHPYIANQKNFKFIGTDIKEPVKLPFANNSFDIVLSMGVLEHVHETGGDQLASLYEICRILKQGGYFLCFHFPCNRGWVESFVKLMQIFIKNKQYVHTKRFSKKDIIQLVSDSGLTLIEQGRYNFLPRNITGKLPTAIANNSLFVSLFNLCDTALAFIAPYFCTQSYFIAKKCH